MLFLSLIFSSLYWVLPCSKPRIKQFYLIFVSVFFIFLYNPLILVLLLFVTGFAIGLFTFSKRDNRNKWCLWLIFLPLFLSSFVTGINWPEWLVGTPRSVSSVNWLFLGMSYYTVKTYISLKLALKAGKLDIPAMVLANTFYPAFVSGPIDGAPKFQQSVCARPFQFHEYLLGWSRIGIGLFKLHILLVWLKSDMSLSLLGFEMNGTQSVDWTESFFLQTLIYSFISFLILYVNFSGFTDFAVGVGKMFHLQVSENFRFPLLSHSIQNFWQRWHLSLSAFIGKYLYKPLLRQTGRPFFSIILTFVLVGLWHRLSVGYLIWGLAHGLLLGLHTRYGENFQIGNSKVIRIGWRIFNTLLTLFVISLLSTIANLGDYRDIPQYFLSYFRFK